MNTYKLPIALVSAIYLYYDGWSQLDAPWVILTPYDHDPQ